MEGRQADHFIAPRQYPYTRMDYDPSVVHACSFALPPALPAMQHACIKNNSNMRNIDERNRHLYLVFGAP